MSTMACVECGGKLPSRRCGECGRRIGAGRPRLTCSESCCLKRDKRLQSYRNRRAPSRRPNFKTSPNRRT